MSEHICKNRLLDLHFSEGNESKNRKTREHLKGCSECKEYMQTLKKAENICQGLEEETPLENTFELIMNTIPDADQMPLKKKVSYSNNPVMIIAAVIISLTLVIFLAGNLVAKLDLWAKLSEYSQLINSIGPLGSTAIFFYLIGLFITLSLSPVLILKSKTWKKQLL